MEVAEYSMEEVVWTYTKGSMEVFQASAEASIYFHATLVYTFMDVVEETMEASMSFRNKAKLCTAVCIRSSG